MVFAVEDGLKGAVEGGAAVFGEGVADAEEGGEFDSGGDAEFVEVDHVGVDFLFGDIGAEVVAVVFEEGANETGEGIDGCGLLGRGRP